MTLSEKLQAAEGGSRALDAEVHAALVPDVFFSPLVLSNQYYTSSLDAALALAERVLPGWWFTAGRCGLTCHASVGPDRAFIPEPTLSLYDDGFHADLPNPSTPALALCAAILAAKEAKAPPSEPDEA